jgi:hypothetical protein
MGARGALHSAEPRTWASCRGAGRLECRPRCSPIDLQEPANHYHPAIWRLSGASIWVLETLYSAGALQLHSAKASSPAASFETRELNSHISITSSRHQALFEGLPSSFRLLAPAAAPGAITFRFLLTL